MSNISRLPPFAKTVHMEVEIPASQRDEFERAMIEIVSGERPRMDALDRDIAAIKSRADAALRTIEEAIEEAIDDNPTTGQASLLVRFLAGIYNGQEYPFDLTNLRGLDTRLANACLDYLNFDRLRLAEVHEHLTAGDRGLHRWIEACGIVPAPQR